MLKPEQSSSRAGSPVQSGDHNVHEVMQVPDDGLLGAESLRDQSSAGLDRLSAEEFESFSKLNKAYRDKFGFPLVVCVRENTKETILARGKERLENSAVQEKAGALVEIAKIASDRRAQQMEPAASRARLKM
jgi:OHCU decarboxylase